MLEKKKKRHQLIVGDSLYKKLTGMWYGNIQKETTTQYQFLNEFIRVIKILERCSHDVMLALGIK